MSSLTINDVVQPIVQKEETKKSFLRYMGLLQFYLRLVCC